MIAFLRKAYNLLISWLIVIACIAFIGYIAWPLLSEKFYSLCSNSSWELCRGEWGGVASADEVQATIESKTRSFFDIAMTAVSDVLSDDGGKQEVNYELNSEAGIYTPVPVESEATTS